MVWTCASHSNAFVSFAWGTFLVYAVVRGFNMLERFWAHI